ncbi:MAG: RnfH family protein [Thiobacillaceae bacterium]|jgi:putative ubiquitin-RnfH superfamily antitoxin RatB of RatAB toxin-antitoxin module
MNKISVEVAYALPAQQIIIPMQLEEGMTIEQAIHASGLLEKFPDINLETNKVGVFGKLAKLENTLRDKDRVEIYRPLIADPKEVRRQRAEQGKVMKKGGGDLAKEAVGTDHET